MPQTSPALDVRGLRKSYGGRVAADGIDLAAHAGRVTAVLGPNGAGKTTTIECCVGLRRPDSGAIHVLGLDRAAPSSAAPLRAAVGVMLQDGGLPMSPRAGDVLDHVTRMYDAPRDASELLDRLDLAASARTPVRRLSGGQRQRLAMACAVVGRPSLVFLDEPSAGLDPRSRREAWGLVRDLTNDGVAVVLSTHLMDEAEELADEVVVIDSGRVVAEGGPAELAGHAVVDVHSPAARGDADAWAVELAAGLSRTGRADLAGSTSALAGTTSALAGEGVTARVLLPSGLRGAPARDVAAVASAVADVDGAEVVAGRRTLEDVFLELTGRTLTDDPPAGDRGRGDSW
ncbi:MAG: ABC transporter ATP-binding protein [Actinomycetaceae bacterium]